MIKGNHSRDLVGHIGLASGPGSGDEVMRDSPKVCIVLEVKGLAIEGNRGGFLLLPWWLLFPPFAGKAPRHLLPPYSNSCPGPPQRCGHWLPRAAWVWDIFLYLGSAHLDSRPVCPGPPPPLMLRE